MWAERRVEREWGAEDKDVTGRVVMTLVESDGDRVDGDERDDYEHA